MAGNKAITYPSGTVIRRKLYGNSEVWELEGKSLSTSTFQLDLSGCKNIKFADEDEDETFKEEKVGCLEKRDIFRIIKTPPYVFAPQFKLIEDPIPLDEQKEHTKDETDKIEDIISKIEDSFKTMPFEVMTDKELK